MVRYVKMDGKRYRIRSYTPNGNMVNADFYYYNNRMKSKWHLITNLNYRLRLAKKFPKKRKN